jgi:hypothetical protein
MIKQKTFNDYESDAYMWLDHMRHAFDVTKAIVTQKTYGRRYHTGTCWRVIVYYK